VTTTMEATPVDGGAMAAARGFVDDWLRVWRDRDGQAYAELLHEDCVFDNPITPIPARSCRGSSRRCSPSGPTTASKPPGGLPPPTASSSTC
jgi:hypothetical protein